MSLRRLPVWLALVGGLCTSPALAVGPGGTLYIKARNTQVKASSDPTAATLVVLPIGKEVEFLGRDGSTPWCKVKVVTEKKGTVQGVVFQSSLGVSPPSQEVSSKNPTKPMSAEAFASSAAAIKAVGPGTLEYGKTLDRNKSAEQLKELLARATRVSPAQVAAYAREAGLPEGGGPADKAGGTGKPGGAAAGGRKK